MAEEDAPKTGRPPFKVTAAMRRRVAIAAGSGQISHQQIAEGLGISRTTLYVHFQAELSVGANKHRLEVLEAMFKAAKKGNVAAAKAYLAADPPPAVPPAMEGDDAAAGSAAGGAEELAAPKPAALGKKAQAQADAMTAHVDTPWAELLMPGKPPPIQ